MKYKAAVFDLDGTLLNSLDDIASSMNAALGKMGFPAQPVEDYKIHVGDGMAVLAGRVLPEGRRTEALIAECVALMRAEYSKNWGSTTRPYAGIPELLDGLVKRGVRLAVLSNKPDDFTQQIVRALLPRWCFDPIFGARTGVPHKPDPAGAIELARLMNLSGGECVFLGDTYADMRAAAGAGMFPVGVTWGFRAAQELWESGARAVIDAPGELLKILE